MRILHENRAESKEASMVFTIETKARWASHGRDAMWFRFFAAVVCLGLTLGAGEGGGGCVCGRG